MVKLTSSTATTPLYRLVRWRTSSMLRHPSLGADHTDQILQPLVFGRQDPSSETGELVIAPARVVEVRRGATGRFGYQVLVHQAFEGAIQRRRPEANLTVGSLQNFLHDSVAVLVLPGEREEDVEP